MAVVARSMDLTVCPSSAMSAWVPTVTPSRLSSSKATSVVPAGTSPASTSKVTSTVPSAVSGVKVVLAVTALPSASVSGPASLPSASLAWRVPVTTYSLPGSRFT